MKQISDRDYDTIVRAARVLQGMRHSDAAIANALRHIVDVSLNEISRLMVLNGYSLGGTNQTYPEWLMQPIGDENDDQ